MCGRPYEGKSGVYYDKAVLDSVKNGPMRRQWLVNKLCPLIMSEKKLDKTLKELTVEGKLIKNSKALESRGGWETLYMLPGHRYLLEVDAGRVIGAIERLKPLLLRMPTKDELAVEIGITPVEAENLVYKLASQTGWYNPTSKLIADARFRLGEALVCAARMRDGYVTENGKSEDFNYEQEAEDANIVEDAKRFLNKNLPLLPILSKDGENVAGWSSEALRYLGDNYIPIDRSVPFCAAINRDTGERIF